MATPRLYGDDLEDPSYLEDPTSVEDVVSVIVSGLRGVKKSLKIYAGEAYWVIFDHPRFLATVRRLANSGVKIQIVLGPAISAGGSKGSPQILELAREGLVDLYYRPTRGEHPHFRILDDQLAIVQRSHPPIQPLHLREIPRMVARDEEPECFAPYVAEFERYTNGHKPVSQPREEFVVLRSSELREIQRLSTKKYDDLEKTDLENLLQEIRQRSNVRKQRVKAAAEMWERLTTNG
jgi:hypothetical protein